ncbi:hypothetical protein EV126DRAFT_421413 [Verticillium dahliae]|nr:hypothetical protein EV126DRAFT_421413 [Verticillium dahliae]
MLCLSLSLPSSPVQPPTPRTPSWSTSLFPSTILCRATTLVRRRRLPRIVHPIQLIRSIRQLSPPAISSSLNDPSTVDLGLLGVRSRCSFVSMETVGAPRSRHRSAGPTAAPDRTDDDEYDADCDADADGDALAFVEAGEEAGFVVAGEELCVGFGGCGEGGVQEEGKDCKGSLVDWMRHCVFAGHMRYDDSVFVLVGGLGFLMRTRTQSRDIDHWQTCTTYTSPGGAGASS